MVYPHCYRTEHSETITTNSTYGDWLAKHISTKIAIQPKLLELLKYVDTYNATFLRDFQEAVAIKSISGNPKYTDGIKEMIDFTEKWMIKLGAKYECFDIGFQEIDGEKYPLPPVILGTIGGGKEDTKKTICVYGHMDVLEPNLDEWQTDPWKVTEVDKKLFGIGTAIGKGPMLSWFHAIQGFLLKGVELPVNIKFIIESMNQSGSLGLEDFLVIRRQDFLYNVDYVIVCESEWLGPKIPCIVYGSIGMLHFTMTVENNKQDPREDMKKIFDSICDDKENIIIPQFNSLVEQVTPDEEKVYETIRDFNIEDYRDALPEHKQKWDQVKLLMSFWRMPSINLGEILECTCDKNDKSKIKREFSFKIVPRQIVDTTVDCVLQHINNFCKDNKLESVVSCEVTSSSKSWFENFRSAGYTAAARAHIQIYKERPNMIREDKDIRCVKIISRVIDKPIIVLPLGNNTINAGKPNENMGLRNFFEGRKVQTAFLFQIARGRSK